MEDEIDLRKYIDVLLRHWKLIVSITVIAVFVAGLVSFLLPPTYEAKASVLIAKGEPKTLIVLAKSASVATGAIEQLGDNLRPEERSAGNILAKIEAREEGNFIEITAKSSDPQKAAAIANAWAVSYEDYVDDFYRSISQLPEEIQAQADAARKEYEDKQTAWEGYIASNRIDELNQQIALKELLCEAKLLREQIKTGSSSPVSAAGNSPTLILLQSGVFTRLPAELGNASLKDIEALISTLETGAGGKSAQSISELRQEVNQLTAELEQETAKGREVKKSREIAWETYMTIVGKLAEAKVAVQPQDAVVHVAQVAVAPEQPVAPRRVMNIGIALVLGLVIGVFGAFGLEYFQKTGDKPEGGKGKEEVG